VNRAEPQFARPLVSGDGRGVVGIPLYDKSGSIRDWASADADSAEELALVRWHLTPYGYAASRGGGDGLYLYMHRFILGLESGDDRQADHINGVRLDNRRANLRAVTAGENRQNQHRPSRGAHFDKKIKRWVAQAGHNYLGCFLTQGEALAAASAYRREHMPFSEADQR